MIIAEIAGAWWSVERTDAETGETYLEDRRMPQFLHDIGNGISWTDVTAQEPEQIIPEPSVCVWCVWGDEALLGAFDAHESYAILRQGEVDVAFQTPAGW